MMTTVNGERKTVRIDTWFWLTRSDPPSPCSLKRQGGEQLVEGTQAKNNWWLWWIRLPWNSGACFLAPKAMWGANYAAEIISQRVCCLPCLSASSGFPPSTIQPRCPSPCFTEYTLENSLFFFFFCFLNEVPPVDCMGGRTSQAAWTSARWNQCNGTG